MPKSGGGRISIKSHKKAGAQAPAHYGKGLSSNNPFIILNAFKLFFDFASLIAASFEDLFDKPAVFSFNPAVFVF